MDKSVPTVLLIDNYDSFVYNLSRYIEELGCQSIVVRNDAVTLEDVDRLQPSAVILSPGPCTPTESGICLDLVQHLQRGFEDSESPPTGGLLGVCLGHQAIAAALGGKIVRAPKPMHGQSSTINHDGSGLFKSCDNPMNVGRYHSLVAEEETLPDQLEMTSRTEDGLLMSFAHRKFPIFGVQFHPESILTQFGHQILENFLRLSGVVVESTVPVSELTYNEVASDDFYQRNIEPDSMRLF